MNKAAQAYVLESDTEFERLERQSTFPKYDYRAELAIANLPLERARSLLDAGCGSGVVSRYLATTYPDLKVIGCDAAASRLKHAEKAAAGLGNLSFQVEDVSRLSFETATFDIVLSRYVLQHVAQASRLEALREYHRCLKPGGRVAIVDFDGSFFNIYPQTPLMKKFLTAFEQKGSVDLRIGRKLPAMLLKAGFSEVRWRIETIECQGADLSREIEMVSEKLTSAMPILVEFLGSSKVAEKFRSEYLETMAEPGTVLFYNKFIVTGRKTSKQNLRLVKG